MGRTIISLKISNQIRQWILKLEQQISVIISVGTSFFPNACFIRMDKFLGNREATQVIR